MTKSELVAQLATRFPQLVLKDADFAVKTMLDAMSEAAPAGAFEDIPNHETDDVLADVRWELESLRTAGVQTAIAVDLTCPEFGIPVIRMIIPGLEWDCTHPRYVPGRRALQARERTE